MKKILLGAVLLLAMLSCNTDESQDMNIASTTKSITSSELKTVTLKKSLDFFKELNDKQLTKKNLGTDEIGLKIDLESLEQIDITDTDAKINIADATTKFEGVVTEIFANRNRWNIANNSISSYT